MIDPETARHMIDALCDEIRQRRRSLQIEAVKKLGHAARPVGLGILLGMGSIACSARDVYGMVLTEPDSGTFDTGIHGDAYGIFDLYGVADQGPIEAGARDLYGIPIDVGVDTGPVLVDAYGVADDHGFADAGTED